MITDDDMTVRLNKLLDDAKELGIFEDTQFQYDESWTISMKVFVLGQAVTIKQNDATIRQQDATIKQKETDMLFLSQCTMTKTYNDGDNFRLPLLKVNKAVKTSFSGHNRTATVEYEYGVKRKVALKTPDDKPRRHLDRRSRDFEVTDSRLQYDPAVLLELLCSSRRR